MVIIYSHLGFCPPYVGTKNIFYEKAVGRRPEMVGFALNLERELLVLQEELIQLKKILEMNVVFDHVDQGNAESDKNPKSLRILVNAKATTWEKNMRRNEE